MGKHYKFDIDERMKQMPAKDREKLLANYYGGDTDREREYLLMAYEAVSGKSRTHWATESMAAEERGYYFGYEGYIKPRFRNKTSGESAGAVWNRLNDLYGFFIVETVVVPNTIHTTSVYFLTEKAIINFDWVNEEAHVQEPSRHVKPSSGEFNDKRMRNGIENRTKTGAKARLPKENLPATIMVDREALTQAAKLIEALLTNKPMDYRPREDVAELVQSMSIARMHKARTQINGVLNLSNNPKWAKGEYPQRYRQNRSGRFYQSGAGLLNHLSQVRKLALSNCFAYDYDNCHISIISQLSNAEQFGAIGNYLENKHEVREETASRLKIEVDVVKEALLAITMGATDTGHSLRGILGQNKDYFLNMHQGLVGELRSCLTRMYEEAMDGRDPLNGIGNMLGFYADPATNTDRQIASHLAQGVESRLAIETIDYLKDVQVFVFDGFYTNTEVDTEDLSAHLLEKTGIHMGISED